MGLTYAHAHTIVSIAVDAIGVTPNSEYIYLYDGTVFNDEERTATQEVQATHGWLRESARPSSFVAHEYPPNGGSAAMAQLG